MYWRIHRRCGRNRFLVPVGSCVFLLAASCSPVDEGNDAFLLDSNLATDSSSLTTTTEALASTEALEVRGVDTYAVPPPPSTTPTTTGRASTSSVQVTTAPTTGDDTALPDTSAPTETSAPTTTSTVPPTTSTTVPPTSTTTEPTAEPQRHSFDQVDLMFADNEPMSVMTSEDRTFEMSRIVRVRPRSDTHIELANFAPVDLHDVQIKLSIEGLATDIDLLRIDTFRAHGIVEIEYPFLGDDGLAVDTNGDVVDLSEFSAGIDPSLVSFDFSSDSGVARQLAALDHVNWTIAMHDFNPDDDPNSRWQPNIRPGQARLFTALVINHAVTWSDPGFRAAFLAEDLTDNEKRRLTVADKEAVLAELFGQELYRCGVVTKVSGLGGGTTMGVADYVLSKQLRTEPAGDVTFAHETGHKLGFNHESNMTYGDDGIGFAPLTVSWTETMMADGGLPVSPSNYYMPTDVTE